MIEDLAWEFTEVIVAAKMLNVIDIKERSGLCHTLLGGETQECMYLLNYIWVLVATSQILLKGDLGAKAKIISQ